jgi:hypothetical protein
LYSYSILLFQLTLNSNSSERVRKLLISAINTNVPINEGQFINAARSLILMIQAVVNKLGKIIAINCSVHDNNYNAIIAEAARVRGA